MRVWQRRRSADFYCRDGSGCRVVSGGREFAGGREGDGCREGSDSRPLLIVRVLMALQKHQTRQHGPSEAGQ
jgi:hypothetical protein